jgi:hypothetical protein
MNLPLLALTLILFGGAAILMGNAIADTWRPMWQNVAYAFLLAIVDQFLGFALFDGPFFVDSLVSSDAQPFLPAFLEYLFDAVVLSAIALLSYRVTIARKMVLQYPWLSERAGAFTWRQRSGG